MLPEPLVLILRKPAAVPPLSRNSFSLIAESLFVSKRAN
jgi:hypothetical protein